MARVWERLDRQVQPFYSSEITWDKNFNKWPPKPSALQSAGATEMERNRQEWGVVWEDSKDASMSVFEQRGGEEQRDREQKQDKSEYVWEKEF